MDASIMRQLDSRKLHSKAWLLAASVENGAKTLLRIFTYVRHPVRAGLVQGLNKGAPQSARPEPGLLPSLAWSIQAREVHAARFLQVR